MSDPLITDPIAEKARRNGEEPAFARPGMVLPNDNIDYGAWGVTKRELFAAMAMQGLLSDLTTLYANGWKAHEVEQFAVMRADALLQELSK